MMALAVKPAPVGVGAFCKMISAPGSPAATCWKKVRCAVTSAPSPTGAMIIRWRIPCCIARVPAAITSFAVGALAPPTSGTFPAVSAATNASSCSRSGSERWLYSLATPGKTSPCAPASRAKRITRRCAARSSSLRAVKRVGMTGKIPCSIVKTDWAARSQPGGRGRFKT